MSNIPGQKVIGTKQTLRAIKNGCATVVYIAKDAEERVTSDIRRLAQENNIQVINVPTMKDLGKAFGIEVGAATAALLKKEDEE